jgi:hypothetical protein
MEAAGASQLVARDGTSCDASGGGGEGITCDRSKMKTSLCRNIYNHVATTALAGGCSDFHRVSLQRHNSLGHITR